MASNTVFFGWDRVLPGREQNGAALFQEFTQYLGGLQQSGAIESWEVAFLDPHGGDMNGFFLIKGSSEQVSSLIASEDWGLYLTRAALNLDHAGAVTGASGELVMERFAMWSELIAE